MTARSIIGPAMPSYTFKIPTPDGKLYVTVAEEGGKPTLVTCTVGKAGTDVSAWGEGLARMVTTALLAGVEVHKIIEELSGITSGKIVALGDGSFCRSGPEGLSIALRSYLAQKYREARRPRGR